MTTSQMSSLKLIPIDEIDAQSWLNQFRKEYLLDTVAPVFNHLVESKLIDSFLEYWVDQELFNDTPDQKKSINNESNSTDSDTTKQDRINLSVLEWSYSHWGNKLESLYLQNKSMLDVVTFRLLRVENKNLSYELYLRLKEKVDELDSKGAKFMVSYDYRDEVYELYKDYNVKTIDLKYMGATDEHRAKKRKEYLILNYEPVNQTSLF